jgi:hypothetical protein
MYFMSSLMLSRHMNMNFDSDMLLVMVRPIDRGYADSSTVATAFYHARMLPSSVV